MPIQRLSVREQLPRNIRRGSDGMSCRSLQFAGTTSVHDFDGDVTPKFEVKSGGMHAMAWKPTLRRSFK
jgi:hypothetical protein